MDNRISDAELLRFAVDNGILDRTTILNNYEMAKRKEILEKHPCRIWQGQTNGYWYTYIPLENGKRRMVVFIVDLGAKGSYFFYPYKIGCEML